MKEILSGDVYIDDQIVDILSRLTARFCFTRSENQPGMSDCSKLHLVIFTGAGIGAESGLATCRDENGLWRDTNMQRLMSVGGYHENPHGVLDMLNAMRKTCFHASPNAAHIKIAELGG